MQGTLFEIALDKHLAFSTTYINDCDHFSVLQSKSTDMVKRELHLLIYHCLCLMLEDKFWGENS